VAAAPPAAYSQFSSTSTASGIVAGVAALILSRFPQLTPAQVREALIESTVATGSGASGASLPPLPPKSGSGAGYGIVNAARAMVLAADITSASQVHPSTAPPTPAPAPPRQAPRPAAAAPKHQSAGTLASSVLRYAVAGVCALIILLVVTLLAGRSRRRRRAAATGAAGPARPAGPPAGGAHARDPRRVPAGRVPAGRVQPGPPGSDPGLSGLPPAGAAAADAWPSPGGWQGGGIGEISHPASATPPTTLTTAPGLTPASGLSPAPKPVLGGQRARSYRASRGAGAPDGSGGPPWEPAPTPGRTIGPLPATAGSGPPPELSARIRVPGDMADPPAETTDPALPRFDLSRPPEGFDLSTPAFGLTPAGFGPAPAAFGRPASGAAAPDLGAGAADLGEAPADFRPALPAFGTPAELPTRRSLDFAAAPVPTDYPPAPLAVPAEDETRARSAADPGFIWDLSATDVFPAAPGSGLRPKAADTRPQPVLPPDDPQDAGGS
jgi:Subtilase family